MDPQVKARFQLRADVIKALAHPTRLFIVDELSRGERCVADLRDAVGDDLSTISKHLTLLRTAGLVANEKRGNQVFYSLQCPCVLDFFGCVETVLQTVAGQQAQIVGKLHELE